MAVILNSTAHKNNLCEKTEAEMIHVGLLENQVIAS